jgi:protein FrlC
MKIGFHTGPLGAYPLTEVIPRLAALGYQGIELNAENDHWGKPHVTPRLGSKKRAEIRQLARDNGIEISSISAHISLLDVDRQARQRHVNFVKGCIDLALDVGTSIVHEISGPAPPPELGREKAWGWLLENIADCTRYAAERGITFAFETSGASLVHSMADHSKFLADLADEKLKVNFDTSHLLVMGENPAAWVRKLGLRIVHVHMKDARILQTGEERTSFWGEFVLDFDCPPLGQGEVKFGEIVDALREIGYQGFLSVEYMGHLFGYHEDRWDPWEAAAQSKRFMDDLLSQ